VDDAGAGVVAVRGLAVKIAPTQDRTNTVQGYVVSVSCELVKHLSHVAKQSKP